MTETSTKKRQEATETVRMEEFKRVLTGTVAQPMTVSKRIHLQSKQTDRDAAVNTPETTELQDTKELSFKRRSQQSRAYEFTKREPRKEHFEAALAQHLWTQQEKLPHSNDKEQQALRAH